MRHVFGPRDKTRAFSVPLLAGLTLGLMVLCFGLGRSCRGGEVEIEVETSGGREEAPAGTVDWRINQTWASVWGGDLFASASKEWGWGREDGTEQGGGQIKLQWRIKPETTSQVGLDLTHHWEEEARRWAGTAEFTQRLAAPGTRFDLGLAGEIKHDLAGEGGYRLWQWQAEMVYLGGGGGDLVGLTWLDNASLFLWPVEREVAEAQDVVSLLDLYVHWLQVLEQPEEQGRVRVKKLGSYKEYPADPSQSSSYDYNLVAVTQPLQGGWTLASSWENYSRTYPGLDPATYLIRRGKVGLRWEGGTGAWTEEQGIQVRETTYWYAPGKNETSAGVFLEGRWRPEKSTTLAWEGRLERETSPGSPWEGKVKVEVGRQQGLLTYGGFFQRRWEGETGDLAGLFLEGKPSPYRWQLGVEISSEGSKTLRFALAQSF